MTRSMPSNNSKTTRSLTVWHLARHKSSVLIFPMPPCGAMAGIETVSFWSSCQRLAISLPLALLALILLCAVVCLCLDYHTMPYLYRLTMVGCNGMSGFSLCMCMCVWFGGCVWVRRCVWLCEFCWMCTSFCSCVHRSVLYLCMV